MSDTPDLMNRALRMAHFFHDTYEGLAASFGYETREETRAFDAMSPNGQLMQAVCARWLEHNDARIRELEAKIAQLEADVCPWCKSKEEGMQAFLKEESQR